MPEGKKPGALGVGIAGCDHWYAALAHAGQTAQDPRARLAAIAHRDEKRAAEVAAKFGDADTRVHKRYADVVNDPAVEVVVTACTAAENPSLCLEAARLGKPVVSVKPMAMTVEAAREVEAEFKRRGLAFFPLETQVRWNPANRQLARWIEEGKLGRPVSALGILRGGVPTQVWPGEEGTTWWTQPDRVPGGGWIDHAIYDVDLLRWFFGSEPVSVSGQVANLRHPELQLEDFGVATITFASGAVGVLEVTWAAPPGGGRATLEIVGSEGAVVIRDNLLGKAAISGPASPFVGWTLFNAPGGGPNVMDVVLNHLLNGEKLPVSVSDGVQNLRTCLAFYQAAREGRTIQL